MSCNTVSRVAQLIAWLIVISCVQTLCVRSPFKLKLCYAVHLYRKDVGLLSVLTHWPSHCPLAGPWHLILVVSLSPVSSFDWALHAIPPGHPCCLPAMVYPTT